MDSTPETNENNWWEDLVRLGLRPAPTPPPQEEAWSKDLAEYTYEPLSNEPRETRILSILPVSDDRPSIIRCQLSKLPFAAGSTSDYDYSALSYTWGNSKERFPIMVDDKKLYVTKSLRDFLRQVRDKKTTLKYWIDAVCINQADLAEREQHVKFMRDIYEKAKAVTVWLGTAADRSGLALKTLRALGIAYKVKAQARASQGLPSIFQMQTLMMLNMYSRLLDIHTDEIKLLCAALLLAVPGMATPNEEFAQMAAEALRKLFDRPWWERVWIVQEVTVPGKDISVMCGSDVISWEMCQNACDFYGAGPSYNRARHSPLVVPFFKIDRLFRVQRARRDETGLNRRQTLGLGNLCKNFMHFGATNNRDRVYALLGLAEDIDPSAYEVDYKKSTIDTYLHMTRFLIKTHQNLDIFGHCYNSSFVSWCPHWAWGYIPIDPFRKLDFRGSVDAIHKTKDGRSLYTYAPMFSAFERSLFLSPLGRNRLTELERFQPKPAYRASGGSEPIFRFEGESYGGSDSAKIFLRGFLVDIVAGDPLPATPSTVPVAEVERTVWEPTVLSWGDTYITGEAMLSAFRRTIRADIGMQNDGLVRRGASVVWDKGELEEPESNSEDGWDDGSSDRDELLINNYVSISARDCRGITRGRSLIRTEKGYMGLTSDGVREGDLVCVLFGGQVAYCLRKNKDETYEFVGECYLHGIMDGEAMEDLANGKYQEREFALR